MKNVKVKRGVIAVLICLMMFSSYRLIFAADKVSDLQGHWAEEQLSSWIEKGLIQGYKDGTIKPNNSISRAELMALVNRSFKFTEKSDASFSDVNPLDWTHDEVAKAVEAGYIQGYSDGTIGIGNKITRQEVAVIIGRLLKLQTVDSKAASEFNDAADFADWGKNFIGAVVANKIMNGYITDHTFKPNKPITRAEAVVTLGNAIQVMANMNPTKEEGTAKLPTPEPKDSSGIKDKPLPTESAGVTPTEEPSAEPTVTPTSASTPSPTPKPKPKPTPLPEIKQEINPNKATPTPTPTPTPSARQTPKPILISTPTPKSIPTIPPIKF